MNSQIFEFIQLTTDFVKTEYGTLFRAIQNNLPGLTDDQIATVVSITTQVCPYCYENTRDCTCMKDD
jgi:hypothetical protein